MSGEGENNNTIDGEGNPTAPSLEVTPPTRNQKIALAVTLLIVTVMLMFPWYYSFKIFQSEVYSKIVVSYKAPADLIINPGPTSFWYDRDSNKLHYRGSIDKEEKKELLKLVEIDEVSEKQKKNAIEYFGAIDELTFLSNEYRYKHIIFLLLLAGFSGTFGVLLRNMVNYVGIACFTAKLDLSRFWLWYLMRPMIGFLLGVLSVVIFEAGFLHLQGSNPTGTIWWVAIAVLAGFGADEFTWRIRDITKAIFGTSSSMPTSI